MSSPSTTTPALALSALTLDPVGDGADVPSTRLSAVNAAIASLQSAITAAQTTLATIGQANGIATLGAGGHVPATQLGSGSASSATILYGDGVFRTAPSAATVTAVTAANGLTLTSGTLAFSGSAYDAAGSAGAVQTALGTHAALTGTAAHGLGNASLATIGTATGNLPAVDGTGKLPAGVIPVVPINTPHTVASQAAMLALTAVQGDVAIRTDLTPIETFILAAAPASTLANWIAIGVIASNTTSIAEGSNLYFTNARAVAAMAGLYDAVGAANTVQTALNTTNTNVATNTTAIATKLTAANNLSDLVSASTARTNLGLGSAATSAASAFDASGLAATVQTNLNTHTAATGTAVHGLGSASTLTAGAANGAATLDSSGKLVTSQIPASLVGALQYQGTWNASTNTPALVSGTGTKGQYYKVATAGSTTIDGISAWNVGDSIIFDGATWDKLDGIASEVVNVFGRSGLVVAQSGDYAAYYDAIGLASAAQSAAQTYASNASNLTSGTVAIARLLVNQPNGLAGLDANGDLSAFRFTGRPETFASIASIVLAVGEIAQITDVPGLLAVGDGITPGGIFTRVTDMQIPVISVSIAGNLQSCIVIPASSPTVVIPVGATGAASYSVPDAVSIQSFTYNENLAPNGNRVTSMVLNNVVACGGSMTVSSNALIQTLGLPAMTVCGALNVSINPLLTSLSVPLLAYVGPGAFYVSSVGAITSLSFPALVSTGVGSNFSVGSAANLTTLSAPLLTTIGGSFSVSSLAALTSLSFPALVAVGSSFSPSTLGAVTTFSFPLLSIVGGSFNPGTMGSLTTMSLPALTDIGGSFSLGSMAALTSYSSPAMINYRQSILLPTLAALTTVTLGTVGTLKLVSGNVTATGCALTQASVDGILVLLASLDGTNGTTAYSSKTVNLSGGTSSTPSSTGATAKATLVARGCTVTTN